VIAEECQAIIMVSWDVSDEDCVVGLFLRGEMEMEMEFGVGCRNS